MILVSSAPCRKCVGSGVAWGGIHTAPTACKAINSKDTLGQAAQADGVVVVGGNH